MHLWNTLYYRVGKKSSTNFTIQLKIKNCQENGKIILFDVYIHKVFLYTQHSSVWTPVSHGEYPAQFFPCASQYAYIDFCDDVPDPCCQNFNSFNLGSTNLILNITPQKEV
jgi:hypothetical protein